MGSIWLYWQKELFFVISASFAVNIILCNQYVLDFLLRVEGGCLITTNSSTQQEIYWEKKPQQNYHNQTKQLTGKKPFSLDLLAPPRGG